MLSGYAASPDEKQRPEKKVSGSLQEGLYSPNVLSLSSSEFVPTEGNMKPEWPAKGVGPSQNDDRFLFVLSLTVGLLAALGTVLYLALR